MKTKTPTRQCRKCGRTLHPADDGRFGRIDFLTTWVTLGRKDRAGHRREIRDCREGGTHDALEA